METDVVIVGGGPGGAASAMHLGKFGIRSVIAERETFPRYHVGESMTGECAPLVRDLGFAEQMRKAGHRVKLRYETARLLIHKVGWLVQRNKSADMDAAMAKLYVSESFVKSCLDAIQIHGGSGFMTELEFEREMRDSVRSTLYSGTSEIQRNIIARGWRSDRRLH